MNNWERCKLPENMNGKTFLDVGCWEGDDCVEALRRNATRAIGIDLCTSESLRKNVEESGFEFIQMDIFSEKFLELGRFDIVLCRGVLYHVENVLSLLFRLRKTVDELLILETAANRLCKSRPILLFHPGSDLVDNPSNWWTPNKDCLFRMLEECGFGNISTIFEHDWTGDPEFMRICVHAKPMGYLSHAKIMPRNEKYMSVWGGERRTPSKKRYKNLLHKVKSLNKSPTKPPGCLEKCGSSTST